MLSRGVFHSGLNSTHVRLSRKILNDINVRWWQVIEHGCCLHLYLIHLCHPQVSGGCGEFRSLSPWELWCLAWQSGHVCTVHVWGSARQFTQRRLRRLRSWSPWLRITTKSSGTQRWQSSFGFLDWTSASKDMGRYRWKGSPEGQALSQFRSKQSSPAPRVLAGRLCWAKASFRAGAKGTV